MKKRGINFFPILLIISASLLILGAEGCQVPSNLGTGIGGGTGLSGFFGTSSTKSGVDFSLEGGVGNLIQGKTLLSGEEFYVKINALNYEPDLKELSLCIKDDISDNFGGIATSGEFECSTKNLPAAEISTQGGSQSTNPSTTAFYFGPYSYTDVPLDVQARLFVKAKYPESPKITANVHVPNPETETLALSKSSAMITTTATKTTHLKEGDYNINLDLRFIKQKNVKIFYASKENFSGFSITMSPLGIQCKDSDGNLISSEFEIKNEKLLSCSALAPSLEQVYPLIIQLDYGVEQQREYTFNIKAATK